MNDDEIKGSAGCLMAIVMFLAIFTAFVLFMLGRIR
jgi:hypothetical protein